MNKRYYFLFTLCLLSLSTLSQTYILNEDFSGASGTTPPGGWTNVVITGGANDTWYFDNPGDRILNYPITDPFAVFDSDSTSANGEPEEVALETPQFDASISNFILLQFNQTFEPGTGGIAKIEAFDGSSWDEVITFTTATSNPSTEIVDLSAIVGGITNARIRFTWSGDGKGYWAIDNIRIYASLPLDGGVVSLDSPNSPVVPGVQNIEITLGNFGYNTITSTTIEWAANGISQSPFNWNGSIGFGQKESGVMIGSYNFQDPVLIKVWQTNPNGQPDPNPYNDTVSKYIEAALCGTYTIGGNNPDFTTFSAAVQVLNHAGIVCPVIFLVRDGIYQEKFVLGNIQGTSEVNTITFRSESGDSTLAVIQIDPAALKYESMIMLNGSQHIIFKNLGLSTGSLASYANNALLMEGAKNITLEGCYFKVQNRFDFGITMQGGSQRIEVRQTRFESLNIRAGAINISGDQTRDINIEGNSIKGATDWGYSTVRIGDYARSINVAENKIEQCNRSVYLINSDSVRIQDNTINDADYGIFIDEGCSYTEISGNRFTDIHSDQNAPDGTSGILLDNSTETNIFNNFITTTGNGPVIGINLQNSTLCRVYFNSINVTNNDPPGKSRGILLNESSGIIARNNIFNIRNYGVPVYITEHYQQLDFDRNDYYSLDQTVGYYDGSFYTDLPTWVDSVNMDMNSLSVTPFYTSDNDLSINQALLNNAGITIAGIAYDIDGALRDPVYPDIGAKEYNPCLIDAGINDIISPENPLAGGTEEVKVLLQNQGTTALTSVYINWSVNGQNQTLYSWSGNLPAGANAEVIIGDYDFQSGILYTLKAWTSQPNNTTDCNNSNDSIYSQELAAPLCGIYTIGGSNPDFTTVSETAAILNHAGITCPVVFLLRNGIYYEQFILGAIEGTSAINTITYRSESGDSTQAIIQINPGALKYGSMIHLEATQHIIFKKLGLFTGSATGNTNYAVLMDGAENIEIEGCYFESLKESDYGIGIKEGSREIVIKHSRFECINTRAGAIDISGNQTRDIEIIENSVKGSTDWDYNTLRIWNYAGKIDLIGNLLERCHRSLYLVNSDSVRIQDNLINDADIGVYLNDFCSDIEISGNRFTDIHSHQNAPDGTSGILVNNSTKTNIFNNFITTIGDGPVIGINLKNSTLIKACFNSINVTNDDERGKSKGILLTGSSGITAKNNIFNIRHSGVPVYITELYPQLDFDKNDYYSFTQTIGYYNGDLYADLPTWVDSVDMDINSLSVTPFYTSDNDLSINQALLNNAGITIAGIAYDIDGVLRDPVHPDMGAKEYNPCPIDAGINGIISPESPLAVGTEEVKVLLQNHGTATLTSVKINWSVNGQNQTLYSWSGNLQAGANAEVIIGDFDFQSGILYTVKAWTTQPNSTTDCNNRNDSITSQELAAPLCGAYTIGGNNPDFTTVSEAVTILNHAGITCPVVFLLRNGIYYEQFTIGAIEGSSAINTITFRSESGDSTQAILQIDPGVVKFGTMIHLEGSHHLIFKGLGFFTGSSVGNANYAILMDGAKNIEIEGCYFESRKESDVGIGIQAGSQGIEVRHNRLECIHPSAGAINISGDQTREIEIYGNKIKGPNDWNYTTIRIGNGTRKIDLIGNQIEQFYRSIYVVYADSVSIRSNIIKNVHDGIYIDQGCSYIEISENQLTNISSHENSPEGTFGIMVNNSSEINLVNNFVQTTGVGPVIGINIQNSTSCRAFFNSVNITNNDAQAKSKGFRLKAGSDLVARNNIFNIKNEGTPFYIDPGIISFLPDYNDYYHPDGMIGVVNGQVFYNLFTWGQTINGDANSKAINPFFRADTIPLPFQRALNGAGIPLPGIVNDVYGVIRNPQAPDIGCMEFLVDYGIIELISPSLDCYHPVVDSVTVYLKQFGHLPFDDLKIAYQLDNGPIETDTIPGPLENDLTHTFGTTVNITTSGDYLFKVWLIGTLDDNINNDTLNAMRYSKPPPVATFDYDNFCTGKKVSFFGQATVSEPYFIDHYEWLFGDGETSPDQNPVHTFPGPGTYNVTLRAYSNAGCYGDTTKQVFIDPNFPALEFQYNIVNETCLGDSTGSIEIIVSGGYPPYNLFVNGAAITGDSLFNLTSGQYEIRVEDSQNCSLTDTVETFPSIIMNPQIQADPLSGITPLTVQFDFTADNAWRWTWYFTDVDVDTNKATSFTFEEYGYHEVILQVQSGPPYYCVELATIQIFVDINVTIDANSVFTPNGDGYNDFFEIKTTGIEEMNVNIFNQWGNKVYKITEVNGKWDGDTDEGAKAPDGTYFYAMKAIGYNDLSYDRQGSVLLLRHAAEVFPNPVSDNVNLKIYDQLQPPVCVSVYSVFGQLVRSESIADPEKIIIDVSNLKSGIYVIKANDGNRNYYVRFIKN